MEIRRLRHAVKRNKNTRLLFELFASREDTATETTVDSLLLDLRKNEILLKRTELVALLQYLESLGCGKFTPGRHAKPSRMSWDFDLRTLGALALGTGDEPLSSELRRLDEEPAPVSSSSRPSYPEETGASCPWDEILNERE
ncbi:MAG: hypothetical protein L0Z50_40440 [Verrucomicrobiales bacterium]|nr:hypothetical protein [Verrucomicrobiales bacterium]